MSTQPVDIGQTIVYGVAFDPKNGDRLKSMDLNELYASVGRLFDLLAERKVDYVLVGGIAMLAYVEGRNTQDIDLIIAAADLDKIPELMVDDRNPDFARAWLGELQVDLLFTKNKLFQYVVKNCTVTKTFAGREVRCATANGLLMMKLASLPALYRQGRFEKVRLYRTDIANLVAISDESPDSLMRPLQKELLASDFNEVRSILDETIRDVRQEGRRFSAENSDS